MSNARFGLRVRNGLVRGITEGLAISDADALAFINAAGITNSTQIGAINNLVSDLKAYGLWSKIIAFYPFVGGTASAHKFNLVNPQDLNAAYRLVFNGGITHNASGITGNGTNGYYDLFMNPSTNGMSLTTGGCVFVYNGNNTNTGIDIIAFQGGVNYGLQITTRDGGNSFGRGLSNTSLTISSSSSLGFFAVNREPNNNTQFSLYQGTVQNNQAALFQLPNTPFYGMGLPGFSLYTTRNHQCSGILYGLTNTEVLNLRLSCIQFNTTLSR